MKIGVIVQARMASSRLPGKVMLPLGGLSILEHVLTRCKAIPGIDVVCCAVPDTDDSKLIIAESERLGVSTFKGAMDDVLSRYYLAAKEIKADVVLRVTADCPMIDPALCGAVLKLVSDGGVSYACNNMPPSWPHGLDCEALTFDCLELASEEADKLYEREHVTTWIRDHPDISKATLIGPGGGKTLHRWTIDNRRDYDFLKAMWKRLPFGPEGWNFRVPLRIADSHPSLAAINAGQDRLEGLKKSMAMEAV